MTPIFTSFVLGVVGIPDQEVLEYEVEAGYRVPDLGERFFRWVLAWKGDRERYAKPLARGLWQSPRMRRPIYWNYL